MVVTSDGTRSINGNIIMRDCWMLSPGMTDFINPLQLGTDNVRLRNAKLQKERSAVFSTVVGVISYIANGVMSVDLSPGTAGLEYLLNGTLLYFPMVSADGN